MQCPECFKEKPLFHFTGKNGYFSKVCNVCFGRRWRRGLEKAQKANVSAEKAGEKRVIYRKNEPIRKAKKVRYVAARRAMKIRATPPWLSAASFDKIYYRAHRMSQETGEKHHVDHIVPLKHRLVCGLHVPWNLQVIPATENLRKTNKFTAE